MSTKETSQHKSKREQCSNCGKMAPVVRRNYRFDKMGLPVVLHHIEVVKCPACNNIDPIIQDLNGLMHALALAVICHPCKLTGGAIRFLRKYVGKGSEEFSRFLHVNHTSLSKIENGHANVGDQTDKYIRLLVINMSPELKDKAESLIELLPQIQDSCSMDKQEIKIDPSTMDVRYA